MFPVGRKYTRMQPFTWQRFSDDALRGLSEVLSLPGKLVLHTGGAVPREVLLE